MTKMGEMCDLVDGVVQAWERDGMLAGEQLELLFTHMATCDRCARTHGLLIPLLRRDARMPSLLASAAAAPSIDLTEAVMRRLPAARGTRMPAVLDARLALTLAACLALLVAVPLLRSRLFPGPSDEVLVRFELVAPGARSVALAGDFNGWQPGLMTPKGPDSGGTWEITVRLRKDSVYTYNFVLDGERWVADPRSQERVEDGFGGLNSVLKL